MEGCSTEYIEAREDSVANMITASEHVAQLRAAFGVLFKREKITKAFYDDAKDSLTFIDAQLLEGKRAIAMQRNARRGI